LDIAPHIPHILWYRIVKVIIAIILGGIIGLERELAGKPAGLRTHMLVAGASTLFVILGFYMIHHFVNSSLPSSSFRGDPIRIMQAVITGISFLGAGTIIFRRKNRLEGLTTAGSILFVTGIGMAVALDQILMGVILTFVVVGILFLVGKLDKWLADRRFSKNADKRNGETDEKS
jgi:putative Mg2+ transporter-C (MgtC) family protein